MSVDDLCSLEPGDAVEVLSRTLGSWVGGAVLATSGGAITVRYGGDRQRIMQLADPTLAQHLRVVEKGALRRQVRPKRRLDESPWLQLTSECQRC
jgi:hypothetical protein